MTRLAAILIALFWSCSALASAQAELKVLCFGNDGHRTVEYGIGSDCRDATSRSVSAIVDTTNFHCGGCTDLPLAPSIQSNSPQAVPVLSPPAQTAHLPNAALTLADAARLSGSPAYRAWTAPPDPRSRYISQRTTIVILT